MTCGQQGLRFFFKKGKVNLDSFSVLIASDISTCIMRYLCRLEAQWIAQWIAPRTFKPESWVRCVYYLYFCLDISFGEKNNFY